MLDIEEQIQRIADVAFERSSPVTIDTGPVVRTQRGRLLALAAVVIAVLGGVVIVGQIRGTSQLVTMGGQGSTSADVLYRFDYVSDPLQLDLEAAIEVSPNVRVSSIGSVLSFDLGALPEGWSARQIFAITITGGSVGRLASPRLPGPTYWQQVAVTSPDGTGLVMNVYGPIAPGTEHTDLTPRIDGAPIEVRGRPGSIGPAWLQWIEQPQVLVGILRGPSGSSAITDISDEMLALANSLKPVMTELVWYGGDEMATLAGPSRPDAVPLLAGTIDGTRWRVAADGTDLQLLIGDETRFVGGTPRTTPDDRDMIDYTIMPISVPGGAIVFGHSPNNVKLVRLHLSNATVDLPVVTHEDQVVFAVPINDLLDPVSITLLSQDETILATISLIGLPPYLGGAIGSGTPIATG